ncbi:uncharacterized protein LOC117570644 isoform X1 [Drosophila albomicans]|uniref:Uncharacterized protein LOC117570644 isoform X1 n=1 Tax=Drosophila albomicans TaxID=7291 RepID=A0A6P8WX44_DROAB|nr:uncharacterized protein LOC117570644 isoform X1 [Drosophila albomicans]XP_051861814.1 uncharacterized protein LOC117570644 isoform X1 [Drosophila albomicans]XP_051861834.1 uncharacterized protein LOC117570644 isoform X1 [Drosophila albomicans]
MSALDSYLKRPAKSGATSTSTAIRTSGSQLSDAAIAATTADVDDLKTDIPYFDDPQPPEQQQQTEQQQPQHRYASAWSPPDENVEDDDTPEPELERETELELELEPELDTEQGNDNDNELGNELDDSYADEDYTSGSSSYYQAPTPANSEIMLRPPSNSSFHYNYPTPAPGAGPGPGGGGHGVIAGSSGNGNVSGQQRLHASGYTHSQTTLAPPPPSSAVSGFYPNMWYPNAPYGSGGAGGGGGGVGGGPGPGAAHGYGRYGGFGGVPPGAAAYAAAAAHGMLQHGHHPHQHPHSMHPHPHPHHPHPHPHSHHPHAHAHHQHPHETMMEMFQLSNSGREARNRAEKNRRDKLNGSIQELSTMVPHVAESPRRVDKTAVLRFAAHGLRLKYVFGKMLHEHRPQVTDTLMGMLDSFFLTLTCHGQILLISSSIEQHLGHCQTDLYGQSILQITHPEDHEMLKQQLIPTELENLFDAHAEATEAGPSAGGACGDGEQRQRSKSEEDYIDHKLRDDKRSFRVRLARAGPRSEPTAYEVVKIDGCFRRSDEAPRGVRSNTFSSSLQLIRRTRGRDDAIPLHTISGNDIVLTACARIIRPPKIVNRLFDANTLEYRTRHLIDGRIIDCDQRIGIVAGYMTDEVRNLNPFTFMHNDDVRWVIVALRQMYDCNSSYGESTYRLFTRNGNIIYLQSKGFLEIDKETNKVHSFVCVNTLLDDEEGKRRVQEMKKKFSVIINTQIPQSTVDVPASEHPAQLEKAVLCLIQNLQNSVSDNDTDQQDGDDDEDDEIEEGFGNMSSYGQLTYRQLNEHQTQHEQQHHQQQQQHQLQQQHQQHPHHQQHHQQQQQHQHSHQARSHHTYLESPMSQARLSAGHGMSSAKTPPLALVPPETASVKSSISKSVSVVNVTAAKHLRGIHATASAVKSPSSKSTTSTMLDSCSCLDAGDMDCDYCQGGPLTPETLVSSSNNSSTNNLKRSGSVSGVPNAQELAKRRFMNSTGDDLTAEIEDVLSNSLQQIERNLNHQLNMAAQLRDQNNRFELPLASQRMEEIMILQEEHEKQSKLYVNIKSEYEEHLQNNKASTAAKSESDSTSTGGVGGGRSSGAGGEAAGDAVSELDQLSPR